MNLEEKYLFASNYLWNLSASKRQTSVHSILSVYSIILSVHSILSVQAGAIGIFFAMLAMWFQGGGGK